MAAGVGSRYGGLKQIEPVGPSGEIIIDYSVYDAMRAGFGKVVFIIRRDIERDFKAIIGSHFEGRAPVEYVYQELSNLPGGFVAPPQRVKPWGTGHAVLCCKDVVREPFAVINADDFYGKESYAVLAGYLGGLTADSAQYAMVGYLLRNTLSEHGSVARGICATTPDGLLESVTERLKVEKTAAGAQYRDEDGAPHPLGGDETASMNMFGFTPGFFAHLDRLFPEFLGRHIGELKTEFLLPTIVDGLIRSGECSMKVLKTPEKWFGVTYKQDKPLVMAGILEQIEAGRYPARLWA